MTWKHGREPDSEIRDWLCSGDSEIATEHKNMVGRYGCACRFTIDCEGAGLDYALVEGDLLDQQVDAIVNAWNRNIIPWWLLLPQGVSGAIKRRAGYQPFKELQRLGPITLGGAVSTSAGNLSYKAIIHVAGINMLWRASRRSIADSVVNAVRLAEELGFSSIAMPIIGAGSGSFNQEQAERIICETLDGIGSSIKVIVVRYKR